MKEIKKLMLKDQAVKSLGQLHKPPKQLYVKGSAKLDGLNLAIVGSRKPTSYGHRVVNDLVADLNGRGVTIVSGLAMGVDTLAHKAALNNDLPTLAVMPCGLKTVYPRSNSSLALSIVERAGALISEYSEHEMPMRHTFIERNRLIAGLADAVLIPEAALKSGSMHTANFALELGIPVLAVPGPITSPLSAGTNRLIWGGATPVLSVKEIVESLGIQDEPVQAKLVFDSAEEEAVYHSLSHTGVAAAGVIAARIGMSVQEVQTTLTMMELDGTVSCLAGEWSLK